MSKLILISALISLNVVFADCPSLKGKYKICSDGVSREIKEDFYNGYRKYTIEAANSEVDEYVEGHEVKTGYQFMDGDSRVEVRFYAYTSCQRDSIYITNSNVRVEIFDDAIDEGFRRIMSNMTQNLISDYTKTITKNDDKSILITRFEDYQVYEVTCK